MLQWRNRELDFASLEQPAGQPARDAREHPRLDPRAHGRRRDRAGDRQPRRRRARAASSRASAVSRLWDVCQIPDYRKISAQATPSWSATLYKFRHGDQGAHPRGLVRPAGGARRPHRRRHRHARQSHRPHPHLDLRVEPRATGSRIPSIGRSRTRAIEDRLSDALHERLTQRFVDRRTSALMRRPDARRTSLTAEIAEDGAIHGRESLRRPPRRLPLHSRRGGEGITGPRATRRPRCWRTSLPRVPPRCGRRGDDAFTLTPQRPHRLARMRRSPGSSAATTRSSRASSFSPTSISAPPSASRCWSASRPGSEPARRAAQAAGRAERSVRTSPGLPAASLSASPRTLGVLRRDAVAEEIKALDQAPRAPAAQIRRALRRLQHLHPGAAQACRRRSAAAALGAPFRPRSRPRRRRPAAPAAARPDLGRGRCGNPEAYWHAAGFHVAGARAVRIDMLERLSDLIRARVSWRVEGGAARRPGATGDGGFRVVPELMWVVGCSARNSPRS